MVEVERTPLTAQKFGIFAANGVIAGIIMAVFWTLVFGLFMGRGFLTPMQLVGAHAFGPEAVAGTHWAAFVFGVFLHLMMTAAWGVAFGIAAHALKAHAWPALVPLGILAGMAMQTVGYIILSPSYFILVFDYNLWRMNMPPGTDWLGHMIFGGALGLLLPLVDYLVTDLTERRPAPSPATT